jgi:hypothetical protein
MPFSSNTFDKVLKEHLLKINPSQILDVGAGAGKNYQIIKQACPNSTIDAIEPTQSYIEQYNLNQLYNKVYHKTLEEFCKENPGNKYNTVLFGDVLEHFFRSEAIDYIDYFLYRSDWVIAIWPTFMPQDDYEGNHYEIHKSNFNLIDLSQKFDIHYYKKQFGWFHWNDSKNTHCEYNYCVMKGYVTRRDTGI